MEMGGLCLQDAWGSNVQGLQMVVCSYVIAKGSSKELKSIQGLLSLLLDRGCPTGHEKVAEVCSAVQASR